MATASLPPASPAPPSPSLGASCLPGSQPRPSAPPASPAPREAATVEEGCSLTTVDDIAAAVHHVLCIIDAEVTSQQLLAVGQ